MTQRVDVLVVGGGPAGLSTAQKIAEAGYEVLVVHQDVQIGHPVRTSGGSWERELRELGIPAHLYQPIRDITFVAPSRSETVHFADDNPVVLDVRRTYEHLADLARQSGAIIQLATCAVKARRNGEDGIVSTIRHNGTESTIRSAILVDATGHGRAMLRSLGLASAVCRYGTGLEYECENRGMDPAHAFLLVGRSVAPSGYGWIFPTRNRTVRVGIGVIHPDTKAAPLQLLESFLASSRAETLGLRLGAVSERHGGVIPAEGPPSAMVYGRCVAVGDAAGQALPLVGEGIRYSIQAGQRAGQCIASSLADPEHCAEHLAQYSSWWNRHHRQRFELAQRINGRISTYSDDKWDHRIRLLGLLNGPTTARLLRMEVSPSLLGQAILHQPWNATRFLAREAWRAGARRLSRRAM